MTGPAEQSPEFESRAPSSETLPFLNDTRLVDATPQRIPFWNWKDAAVLFGLGVPTLVLAAVALRMIASALHLQPDSPAVTVTSQGVGYVALFAILAMIFRVNYDAPFWRSLGWIRSRLPDATAVLLGGSLSIAIAFAGGLLHVQPKQSEMQRLLHTPGGPLALAIFGVTLAPLAEELCFRGFLQPLFIRAAGVFAGILLTGSVFGMLHFQEYGNSWGSAALVSVAGTVFGVIRYASGSTRSSVLAHVGYNGTLFALFFAAGRIMGT